MHKLSEKELYALWKKRKKDFAQSKSFRQKKLDTTPTRAGHILYNMFKSDTKTILEMEKVRAINSWPKLVGNSIAAFSSVRSIKNGKLIIYVKDPVLREELIFLKSSLIKKYKNAFPTLNIHDIYFVVT